MATYKAEFLSHYYEGRIRPRHAYAMGWVFWWSRLAALMPELVNTIAQAPVVRDAVKWLGGIAPNVACRNLRRKRSKIGFARTALRCRSIARR